MLRRFCEFIGINGLVMKNDRVLLAVSGGVDSVAMAELFHQAGIRFGIAHCNFGLRGKESEEDERFVEGLAKKYRVPFHSKKFLTAEDAKEKRVSIQMAARELRYKWFEEVRTGEGYSVIATGHHLDDQVETFFINLLRGTGISGLHGILPKHGNIIRPMLFATRDEIGEFVRSYHLPYREDSSNNSRKYLRNRIRLELIPLLREINPGIGQVMTENILRIREAAEIYRQKIREVRERVIRKSKGKIVLPIAELKALKPGLTWLYELLAPYGFNESMVADLAASLHKPGKKEFVSEGWKAVKDREEVILTRRTQRKAREPEEEFQVKKGQKTVEKPIRLILEEILNTPGTGIPAGKEYASLDLDKLEFPLALRRWKPGDAFVPFGMTRKKKISDFFINSKVSSADKENSWILWSGQKIAWVVGHRPDNRFRVTSRTRAILRVRVMYPQYC